MKVVTWNVEWALSVAPPGRELLRRIQSERPEVLCLTETYDTFQLPAGHRIASQADYGYPVIHGRRKVALWSMRPWRSVDQVGSTKLPSGRFVSGITETSIGPIKFVGVCVPWRAAHVSTGRRNGQPWEDHLAYLNGLKEIIQNSEDEIPTLVLGDFNQRIPRRWSPPAVYEQLMAVFENRFRIATEGLRFAGASTIDHIAISSGLEASDIRSISNIAGDARKLSDHYGIVATVNKAGHS